MDVKTQDGSEKMEVPLLTSHHRLHKAQDEVTTFQLNPGDAASLKDSAVEKAIPEIIRTVNGLATDNTFFDCKNYLQQQDEVPAAGRTAETSVEMPIDFTSYPMKDFSHSEGLLPTSNSDLLSSKAELNKKQIPESATDIPLVYPDNSDSDTSSDECFHGDSERLKNDYIALESASYSDREHSVVHDDSCSAFGISDDSMEYQSCKNCSPDIKEDLNSDNIVVYIDDPEAFAEDSEEEDIKALPNCRILEPSFNKTKADSHQHDKHHSPDNKEEDNNPDNIVVYLDDPAAFAEDSDEEEMEIVPTDEFPNPFLNKTAHRYQNVDIIEVYNNSDRSIDDPEALARDSYDEDIEMSTADNSSHPCIGEPKEDTIQSHDRVPHKVAFGDAFSKNQKGVKKTTFSALTDVRKWTTADNNGYSCQNGDSKKGESVKKRVFISEDPEENLDINHPEWEAMSRFTSDEDCYRSVRECWKSRTLPNPQRDLTYHSHRLRRTKQSNSVSSSFTERKRLLSDDSFEESEAKRSKTSCTLVVDERIRNVRKKYRDRCRNEEFLLNKTNKEIDDNFNLEKENLRNQYISRLKRLRQNSGSEKQHLVLLEWIQFKKEKLLRDRDYQRKKVKNAYDLFTKEMKSNLHFMLRKLREAKEEIFKFNQFYSNVNSRDITTIQGKLLKEAENLNRMYDLYEYHYTSRGS